MYSESFFMVEHWENKTWKYEIYFKLRKENMKIFIRELQPLNLSDRYTWWARQIYDIYKLDPSQVESDVR